MHVVGGRNPDGEVALFIHGFRSSSLQEELP